jgi:hypothetical protein
MDPNDWTPARGWAIALCKGATGAAILAGVWTGVLYVAWPLDGLLPPHWAIMALLLIVSGALGYPAGCIVSRKLAEDSGLAGRSLIVPMLTLLIGAAVLAYHVALWVRGAGGLCGFSVAIGLGFWSNMASVRTLFAD